MSTEERTEFVFIVKNNSEGMYLNDFAEDADTYREKLERWGNKGYDICRAYKIKSGQFLAVSTACHECVEGLLPSSNGDQPEDCLDSAVALIEEELEEPVERIA